MAWRVGTWRAGTWRAGTWSGDSAATLPADSGSYTLTGQDAALSFGRRLQADGATYALTGQDAALTYTPVAEAYTLTAEGTTYSLSGQSANLVYSGSSNTGGWWFPNYVKKKKKPDEEPPEPEEVVVVPEAPKPPKPVRLSDRALTVAALNAVIAERKAQQELIAKQLAEEAALDALADQLRIEQLEAQLLAIEAAERARRDDDEAGLIFILAARSN